MKQQLLTWGLVFGALFCSAQADVTSAYMANKESDYEKAAEYIEKALGNQKAITKEKTWRYRGQIYLNIAQIDTGKVKKYPDALQRSIESFMKAMELDKKNSYKKDNEVYLNQLQIVAVNRGIELFSCENYELAASSFIVSEDVYKYYNQIDTTSIWSEALCYEKSGLWDKAVEGYKKCANLGYEVPQVYLYISHLQKENGLEEEAFQTLTDAREKYPNDQGLIIEELNVYLISGRFEEAENNLKLAAAQDPTNKVLWFSLGSVYDNLGRIEDAEGAYKKAIDIDSDYFEANYNLGALQFNRAVSMVNDANEIPPSENTKYNKAMEDVNAVFALALPYLEKAHELNPNDVGTMRSLKDIYIRTGNDEMYMDMKSKLGE